jgi:hypothetical protein
MANVTIGMWLVLFLPFVLSLAGKAGMPKVLCLWASLLALLLSVEPLGAVLPWALGMAVAVISVRDRMLQLRAVGVLRWK